MRTTGCNFMILTASSFKAAKSGFTITSLSLSLLLFGSDLCGAPDTKLNQDSRRPNILFIMIDDLGWMDLNCQGNRKFTTPNIDRLFAQGMRFTNAYAAAPVCSPTRAAAITGLAPARLKVTNHNPDRWEFYHGKKMGPAKSLRFLESKYDTIAEYLKKAGYETAFMGKWHLSEEHGDKHGEHQPENQGFDLNIGGCHLGGPRTFFAPYAIVNMVPATAGDYLPYTLADQAVKFLTQQQDRTDPFLLCLWHYTVHYPIQAPADLLKKHQTGDQKPTDQQRYQAMVDGMDIAVGRVLTALSDLGLAKNTLAVFTSDNGNLDGYSSANPLKHAKGYLSEGGIRVPLAVRFPGVVKPGSTSDEPVISMDFVPTFLDAVGIKYDAADFDGQSMMPVLKQSDTIKRESIYFHYPHYAFHGNNRMGSAIRSGHYKLITYYDGHDSVLYNLRDDIGETRNLATRLPEKVETMTRDLKQWLKTMNATFPRPLSEVGDTELTGRRPQHP